MDSGKLFEIAARNRYTYPSTKGEVNTEDLWMMNLESLDASFKMLNKRLNLSKEESLLDTKSTADKRIERQIEIIKYIVDVKKTEASKIKEQARIREETQKVLQALAELDEKDLKSASREDLMKKLNELQTPVSSEE